MKAKYSLFATILLFSFLTFQCTEERETYEPFNSSSAELDKLASDFDLQPLDSVPSGKLLEFDDVQSARKFLEGLRKDETMDSPNDQEEISSRAYVGTDITSYPRLFMVTGYTVYIGYKVCSGDNTFLSVTSMKGAVTGPAVGTAEILAADANVSPKRVDWSMEINYTFGLTIKGVNLPFPLGHVFRERLTGHFTNTTRTGTIKPPDGDFNGCDNISETYDINDGSGSEVPKPNGPGGGTPGGSTDGGNNNGNDSGDYGNENTGNGGDNGGYGNGNNNNGNDDGGSDNDDNDNPLPEPSPNEEPCDDGCDYA